MNKGKWQPIDTVGGSFFDECKKIVEDESLFDGFKLNPIFCNVIGNDMRDKNISDQLFEKIKNKEVFKDIEKYKSNDVYGKPILYNYEECGNISPGTLYFLNVLDDILTKVGDIQNFNVVEIGTGYGGQAKIILDYGVKSYTCVDVKEPLSLCKKYLDLFNYNNVSYITTNDLDTIDNKQYNLIISNWCVSEFDDEGISFYLEKIIKNCDYGYFLMNIWDKNRKDSLLGLFSKYFSVVETEDEFTKTSPHPNFLLFLKK